MKLYASDINNLTDARYFAAWGVDFIGFSLINESNESIGVLEAKAIIEWLEGPQIVGQFGNSPADKIKTEASLMGIQNAQLGDLTGLDVMLKISDLDLWKEIDLSPESDESSLRYQLEQFAHQCEKIVLNFQKNNIEWEDIKAGNCLSIEVLKSICEAYPIVLSMNFTPDNLQEIIESVSPKIISLKGGEEEKVGFKSFDELDDLFEILEDLRGN